MSGLLIDLARMLRFYSRIPVPRIPGEEAPYAAPDFARIARIVPIGGALIGLIGAGALLFATRLGLGELASAIVAVAVLVAITGAFHEDGLADAADGLGGTTVEQRLEIMTDSRIGTYGVMAVVLVLLLRIVLLAELTQDGMAIAAAALVASAACSRTAALWLSVRLPPARVTGAAFATGRPETEDFVIAGILAAIIAGLMLWPTTGLFPAIVALAASAAVAAAMTRSAERVLGGQTGDIAGATQQCAEIAFLAAVFIFTAR